MPKGWNAHVRKYIIMERLFKQVMFVRYEDIVEAPLSVLQEVVSRTGRVFQEGALRRHLDSRERQQALRKLSLDGYGANFSQQEIAAICKRIEHKLLARFGYSGCEDRHQDDRFSHVVADLRTPSRGKCRAPLSGYRILGEPMMTPMHTLTVSRNGGGGGVASDWCPWCPEEGKCLSGSEGWARLHAKGEDCHQFVLRADGMLESTLMQGARMCLILFPYGWDGTKDEWRIWECVDASDFYQQRMRFYRDPKSRKLCMFNMCLTVNEPSTPTWGESAESPSQCCAMCNRFRGCQGYDYVDDQCFLLSDVTGTQQSPRHSAFVKSGVLP